MHQNKYRFMLIMPLMFLLISVISAQTADIPEKDVFAMDLEELMNTKASIATKSTQTINTSPSIVSVMTSEDIKNIGARQLEDLLQMIPGFDISMTYNAFYTTGIRGVRDSRNTSKLLIMIDGNPINQIFHGCAIMYGYDINLDDIERIEVIRGPGSALYGRYALSGVINIITKNGKSGEKLMIKGTMGTYDTKMISGFGGYKKNKFDISVGLKKLYTQCANTDFNGNEYKVEKDNLLFNTNISFGKFTFSGIFSKLSYRVENSYIKRDPSFYSLSYVNDINPRISVFTKIFGHQESYAEDIQVLAPNIIPYYPLGLYYHPKFKEYRYAIENEWKFYFSQTNSLLAGFQADLHGAYNVIITSNADSLSNPMPYPLPGRGRDNQVVYKPGWLENDGHYYQNVALLVQDIWHPVNALGVTVGARYDYDSQIGSQFNPRLGFVFKPTKNTDLKLLYGRAFRTPGPGEQYATLGFAFGNKNLKPEIINTFELASMYRTKNTTNSISLYWNNMGNMIYAPLGIEINPDFKYHNIGKNISKGIEFENKSVLSKHLYFFMNASYTVSENRVAINDKDSIYGHPDVAPFKFNFGVNYWFLKHFNSNLNMFYRSKMGKFQVFNPATGTNVEVQDQIGNYAIFNFTLRVKELIKNIEFSFSAYNILNTKYYSQDNEHIQQPPQQGRQLLFNLCYAF